MPSVFRKKTLRSVTLLLIMDDLSSFLTNKANDLIKGKKFEEALKIMDEVRQIKEEQKSPDFWYVRGLRLCDVGEYEQALECFDNDLTLNQKSFNAFFKKGQILFQLKRYAEAIECFNKSSEIHHQQYLQSKEKAQQLKKVRKFEKSLIYHDLAAHEKPLDESFWYYKGLAMFKLQKYDVASSCFTKALEIKQDKKILYELAKCDLRLGNVDKCLKILEEICDFEPFNKEKLRVDIDFDSLTENNKFRKIIGL